MVNGQGWLEGMSGARIRSYEILAEIGVGGMSRVYLANDPQSGRQVAIKLLPPEYLNDLGFRARFEQEARVIAALAHPAIVPVYEFGVYQGQPFIVMQYMPNGSLFDRLSPGPLSPDLTAKALARISNALDYAHHQGIIHRDLKPSNILFDQSDSAFLADFGIALQSGSTWQRNLASGTPAYMSPEQALRKEVIDPRSDVYSLGIIAFEMLTGVLPFDGDLPVSIVLKQIYDPPPSLGAVNPDSPAALDPVLQRALAKDPMERFQSAEDFSNTFERALHPTNNQSSVIEREQIGDSTQQLQVTIPGSADEVAPGETVLLAKRPNKTVFPDFSFLSARRRNLRSNPRPGYYFFALGLVTWIAVLLAAMTALIARAQELFPSSNVEVVYNESAIAVVNISNTPIDLSNLVFERLSDQGKVTAAFPVEKWDRVTPGALRAFPAGGCFQLLRFGRNDYSLMPGTTPAKPPTCNGSQGWLVATDQTWHFWIPEGDGERFQVVQSGRVIRQCPIADENCDFYLPKNK